VTQTEDASLKTVVVAAAANLTPSYPAADRKMTTCGQMAASPGR